MDEEHWEGVDYDKTEAEAEPENDHNEKAHKEDDEIKQEASINKDASN